MKKIVSVLVVIVVLVAAWLGATWYTGRSIEAQISDKIALVNESWAKGAERLELKTVSYERGLFSTHARYALAGGALPADEAPAMDVTIWHGPFPNGMAFKKLALHAEVVPAGTIKVMTGAMMNGKPPLVIDASSSYGDHYEGTGNVPAIDFAPAESFKLAFGGVQMRFTGNWRSSVELDAQILPLTINGQDFGSGQWTATGNMQGVNEALSWKTGKGESKLAVAVAMTRPMNDMEDAKMAPEEALQFIAKNIKTASLHVSLSRPMIVDIGARVLHLSSGADLDAAQQQVSQMLDSRLAADPHAQQFIRIQDGIIASNWEYAGGKLTINGEEHPEMLEQISNGFATMMKMSAARRASGR